MTSLVHEIQNRLKKIGNDEKAKVLQRFFKTGPGEYGEGDIFIGVKVPELRKLAREYQSITEQDVEQLLQSLIHEERLLALLILVRQYAQGDEASKRRIYELYLNNIQYVNNWDLVDASAEHIVGAFLMDKDKEPLFRLAKSENLWERRISVMATFHFIKRGHFSVTLDLVERLLSDKEDLIHKATGWMLREIGKRAMSVEEDFLGAHYQKMPRTMLRYAIERFPECRRQKYLRGQI